VIAGKSMSETNRPQGPQPAQNSAGSSAMKSGPAGSGAGKAGMDVRIEGGITLTERQLRARNARSLAIALSLGALVILFYIVTLVKGPGVLVRPL
jgi:hypothetical protein